MNYFSVGLMCGVLAVAAGAAGAADKPVTLGIECEDFQFLGDWSVAYNPMHFSGKAMLANGDQGAATPAVTAIQLPRAGRYALWARAADFPDQKPGTRLFKVSLGGQLTKAMFGHSGQPGYTWEPGGVFELPAGPDTSGTSSGGSIDQPPSDQPPPEFGGPANGDKGTGAKPGGAEKSGADSAAAPPAHDDAADLEKSFKK